MAESNSLASILTQFLWGFRDSFVGIRILFHREPPDVSDSDGPLQQISQQNPVSTTSRPMHAGNNSPPMSVLAQRRAQRKVLESALQRENQPSAMTVRPSGSPHELPAKPISDLAKIKNRLALCCILNGGIFLVSIVVFDYLFMPMLEWCTAAVMKFEFSSSMPSPTEANDFNQTITLPAIVAINQTNNITTLPNSTAMNESLFTTASPSSTAADESSPADVSSWQFMLSFMRIMFSLFWLWPVFLLSRLVNTLWFQDVADATYYYLQKQRSSTAVTTSQRFPLVPVAALQHSLRPRILGISQLVADIIFSTLVLTFFLIQASLALLIPIEQLALISSYVHLCLLYALYAFEYKWLKDGIDVRNRIGRVEMFWPYFVGFGTPMAILTSLTSSYLIAGGLFAIIFPLFIVSASDAEAPDFVLLNYYNVGAEQNDSEMISEDRRRGRFFVKQIPLFSPSVMLTNWIFTKFSNTAVQRQRAVAPPVAALVAASAPRARAAR